MLVYLVRQFTFDQVNHIAKNKNPKLAVELDKTICRNLGIGNSTGLGMAPFIVNHPTLLNNWIIARENVLKKIREIKKVSKSEINIFYNCLIKSLKNITNWNTESDYQNIKIKNLIEDLKKFIKFIKEDFNLEKPYQFNYIYVWAEENLGDECVEYLVSMMMEPYDEIVEPFVGKMSSEEDDYFNKTK